MRNLGSVSERWLQDIGVIDVDGLRALGSVEAYLRIRAAEPRAGLNLLYALEGAILDVDWRELPLALKRDLKAQVRGL